MGCKTLKIGVFFDGTGNNALFDSSDGRDQQSNIAKLYALYKKDDFEREDGTKVTAKSIYVKGIGTYDTKEEYDAHPIERKYDKGGGGGGAKRIEEAIDRVVKILDSHPYDPSDDGESYYQVRLIDVFGFSRGAATARDFVNTFYKKKVNLPHSDYTDVRFNFIGIYDTVGSFGKPGNNIDMKSRFPELFDEDSIDIFEGNLSEDYGIVDHNRTDKILTAKKLFQKEDEAQKFAKKLRDKGAKATVAPYYPPSPLGPSLFPVGYIVIAQIKEYDEQGVGAYVPYNFNLCIQSAKKIVHMTAHDEVRKNFPLTNIKGSGGLETSMLGVHSDVGGGYAPVKMEHHEFPYRGHYRRVRKAAERKAKELSSRGGVWHVERAHCARNGVGSFVLIRKVINDLSNVTLNLMYEQATAHHVDFEPMPQDENHAVLPSLEGYYAYAREHLINAYTYAQTDDGAYLAATQRHHSAVDPAGKSTHYVGNTSLIEDAWKRDSADGGGNDARYVDKNGRAVDGRKYPELAVRVERAVFDNKQDRAVSPKENNSY